MIFSSTFLRHPYAFGNNKIKRLTLLFIHKYNIILSITREKSDSYRIPFAVEEPGTIVAVLGTTFQPVTLPWSLLSYTFWSTNVRFVEISHMMIQKYVYPKLLPRYTGSTVTL